MLNISGFEPSILLLQLCHKNGMKPTRGTVKPAYTGHHGPAFPGDYRFTLLFVPMDPFPVGVKREH